jgi:hypothetical protein
MKIGEAERTTCRILPSAALAWRQNFALAYGSLANHSLVSNKPDRSAGGCDYAFGPMDGFRAREYEIASV